MTKLLITNHFLSVTCRQGADHKKVFAVATTCCVSVRNQVEIVTSFPTCQIQNSL